MLRSSEASHPLDNQGIMGSAKALAMCSLRNFSEGASATLVQALEMTLPK